MSERALEVEKIGIQRRRSTTLSQSIKNGGSPSFASRKSFAAVF